MSSPGLCACGCGGKTTITPYTDPKRGFVKGEPKRFLPGHNSKDQQWSEKRRAAGMAKLRGIPRPQSVRDKVSATHKARGIKPSREAIIKSNLNRGIREKHPSWRGGISYVNGYKCVYRPEHPRAHPNGYIYEHILLVEEKIGRSLYKKEVVHHVDGNKLNNDPDNLEVLASQADHMRVHRAFQ